MKTDVIQAVHAASARRDLKLAMRVELTIALATSARPSDLMSDAADAITPQHDVNPHDRKCKCAHQTHL